MITSSAALLVLGVGAVGILHTLVPDHWAPISMLARQQGWSALRTARAAALAGVGHTISTLAIGLVVWLGGVALAFHYGYLMSMLSSLALLAFGTWMAVGSIRDLRARHTHVHRHENGIRHRHSHEHHEDEWHAVDGNLALVPIHEHEHETSSRTALILILGSSPTIEGIPAFFSASRFGSGLLTVMAIVFAACTIGTYVAVTLASFRAIRDIDLGPIERYGEVMSGAFIAFLGVIFLVLS